MSDGSVEETSLRLVLEWLDSVSNEEFLNEFNSLGDKYRGITIGEFLGERCADFESENEDE